MIAPWQVWSISLGSAFGVVVSSDFHLGLSGGRTATIVPTIPMTPDGIGLDYRVLIANPIKGARWDKWWAMTDQIRTIDTLYLSGKKAVWTVTDKEIAQLKSVLKHMVAF